MNDLQSAAAMTGEPVLRVLVVEDEALVALNLETILEDLGHRVLGPVMRLERLRQAIDEGLAIDVAILDVNIAGLEVFPEAERLDAAGVPIMFATGYGRDGLPERWRDRPVVQKPYSIDDIRKGMAEALGRVAAGA